MSAQGKGSTMEAESRALWEIVKRSERVQVVNQAAAILTLYMQEAKKTDGLTWEQARHMQTAYLVLERARSALLKLKEEE